MKFQISKVQMPNKLEGRNPNPESDDRVHGNAVGRVGRSSFPGVRAGADRSSKFELSLAFGALAFGVSTRWR